MKRGLLEPWSVVAVILGVLAFGAALLAYKHYSCCERCEVQHVAGRKPVCVWKRGE